ncbi:MAG: helix-turn-helix transcriptional regulator, partial [Clostridia bacterium]|nr:helix-turn-helix transcriptional regulator [Clostridia bacterium]
SGGLYDMKEATLYTAFRRLEADKLITSYWGESEGGARRRYYRITEKGRQAYRAGLESWRETKTIIDGLLERGAVSNEEKA